ncbi:hypothetical protein ACLBWS_14280 [Brucellaceae bacterium D45D]
MEATGILKWILKTADDPDPLERLKVVEFVLFALKDWLMTGEDLMMDAVEKPLLALACDQEPAICELAILALEFCAARCWVERAYGRYKAVCRLLAERGFNAHLQYARLAESAYAAGDIPEGDRLLEIGREGACPGAVCCSAIPATISVTGMRCSFAFYDKPVARIMPGRRGRTQTDKGR